MLAQGSQTAWAGRLGSAPRASPQVPVRADCTVPQWVYPKPGEYLAVWL